MINMENQLIITKKLAKQGDQIILVIPKILHSRLKPQTLVEAKLRILEVNNEF